MSIPLTPSPLTSIIAAKTYNAAWFPGATKEAQITNAIAHAATDGALYVYVPANMLPYTASSVTFDSAIRMVREGGNMSVYDIKAYGSAGDNVTDGLAGINAAVAAIKAAGQGVLYIPGSLSHIVSGRILIIGVDNLTICGDGWGPSVIKMKDGVTNPGFVIDMYDCTNTTVKEFSINGNRNNFAAGWNEFNGGIRWGANGGQTRVNENLSIEKVHIYNTGGDSILITGSTGTGVVVLRHITIERNILEDPNAGGAGAVRSCVSMISGIDATISKNFCQGASIASSRAAFDLEPDVSPAGLVLKDITISENMIVDMPGIAIGGGNQTIDRVEFVNNKIRTHATFAQYGVAVGQYVTNSKVADNTIFVQEAGNSGYGIGIDIGGFNNTVDGNDVRVSSTGSSGNGIQTQGAADLVGSYTLQITNNQVYLCKLHGILSKRPMTLISGNTCHENGGDGIRLDNTSDKASGTIVTSNVSIANTGWGVNILAGLSGYIVANNQLGLAASGYQNTIGALTDAALSAFRFVHDNMGDTTGIGTVGSQRTTIGANGAATALTANPVGYVDILLSAGSQMQIPYYNKGA